MNAFIFVYLFVIVALTIIGTLFIVSGVAMMEFLVLAMRKDPLSDALAKRHLILGVILLCLASAIRQAVEWGLI